MMCFIVPRLDFFERTVVLLMMITIEYERNDDEILELVKCLASDNFYTAFLLIYYSVFPQTLFKTVFFSGILYFSTLLDIIRFRYIVGLNAII